MDNNPKSKGVVALTAVLIISAGILIIAVAISLSGLSELQAGYYYIESNIAVDTSDSCYEEAAYRLKLDSSFTTSSFDVGDGGCSIFVSTSGTDDRIISASSTASEFTSEIDADVTIVENAQGIATGIDLFNWLEL